MHTQSQNSDGPNQKYLKRYLVPIFGKGAANAAAEIFSGRQIRQTEFIAAAALLKPFCSSSSELIDVIKSLGNSKISRLLEFCTFKTLSLTNRGRLLVQAYEEGYEFRQAERLYYLALVRFVGAAREVGLEISFPRCGIFEPFWQRGKASLTFQVDIDGDLRRDSLRMLLVAAAVERRHDLVQSLVNKLLGERSAHIFHREDIRTLSDSIFHALGAKFPEERALIDAADEFLENRLPEGVPSCLLRLTVGANAKSIACFSDKLDSEIENLMARILEACEVRPRHGQQDSSGVLFVKLQNGRSLLEHLSIDSCVEVPKGAAAEYSFAAVLQALIHCNASGNRLTRAIKLSNALSGELGEDSVLSLRAVDYSLRWVGLRETIRAIRLADGLLRHYGRSNHSPVFKVYFDEGTAVEVGVGALVRARRALAELGITHSSPDYFRLGYLAVQMLSQDISAADTVSVLGMAEGKSLSHLLLCAQAMIQVWKQNGVPSTPGAMLEQVRRDGYLGMLVLWAGDRRLLSSSYSAIGKSFEAEYRREIQRLESSGRDPSYWLGELKTISVTAFTAAYVQGRFKQGRLANAAQEFLRKSVLIDSPPYRRDSNGTTEPGYDRCYAESIETIYKALSLYFGQGAKMFAARRSAPHRDSALVDFAKQCCEAHKVVGVARDSYPGAGVVMKYLKVERVVPKAAIVGDLALTLPLISRTLPYLRRSQLCYLRGCRIVIPPESIDFSVFGEPMALLAFQDHFGDPAQVGVVLVARTAAERSRDRLAAGKGFSDSREVLDFCRAEYKQVLHISSISCLGGLCNSFDVGSPPLWGWENLPNFSRSTRDFSGHIHKYYGVGAALRGEQSEMTLNLLKGFANAHDEVYAVATRLFEIELAWRFAMQRHQLGHFYGTSAGEDIYSDSPARFEGDLDFPKFGFRALQSAINWHVDLRSANHTNRDDYPVFVIANPFDHWSTPPTNVYLDTFNMELFDNGERQQIAIPENYTLNYEELVQNLRAIDRAAWKYRIWGPAESSGFELRPEHRRRLRIR